MEDPAFIQDIYRRQHGVQSRGSRAHRVLGCSRRKRLIKN